MYGTHSKYGNKQKYLEKKNPVYGSKDPDPDPPQNVMDPEHWYAYLGILDRWLSMIQLESLRKSQIPGSRIQKQQQKREVKKKISCHTFFCKNKFHKIVNYF